MPYKRSRVSRRKPWSTLKKSLVKRKGVYHLKKKYAKKTRRPSSRYSKSRRGMYRKHSSKRVHRLPLNTILSTQAIRSASYVSNTVTPLTAVDRQAWAFIDGPDTSSELGGWWQQITTAQFIDVGSIANPPDYVRFFNLKKKITMTYRPPPYTVATAQTAPVTGTILQMYTCIARTDVPRTSEQASLQQLFELGFVDQVQDAAGWTNNIAQLSTSPFQNNRFCHYFKLVPHKTVHLSAKRPSVTVTLSRKFLKYQQQWDDPVNMICKRGAKFLLIRYFGELGMGVMNPTTNVGMGRPHNSNTSGIGLLMTNNVQYILDYNTRTSYATQNILNGPYAGEAIFRVGVAQQWGSMNAS
ncbi:capsid protein [Blackfly DNA Virus 17]|nr:capsid protein [Blackfly DNA Virus 17]